MRPWRRRRTPHPTPTPDHPQVRANRYFPFLAELESAGFLTVLTRMPGLLGLGARWAWRASPRDTVATVGFNVAAGVFTAFALVSVAGVLEALFAEGPTPERVGAALPSLMLVAGAVAAQVLLQAAAGWAQARLDPQVERVAELALFDLTSRIKLEAFDDSEFNDQMARARDRLASVQMADRIYVLRKGEVIEQGTHQELMSIPDGHYRELFTIQATAYTGIAPG